MRIVVAPQEFKGSLTAIHAARAISDGVRAALPDAEIVEVPMSDGGPGLVDAMLAARGGERVETAAHDPLMREIRASWALLAGDEPRTAVIEMAAASRHAAARSARARRHRKPVKYPRPPPQGESAEIR